MHCLQPFARIFCQPETRRQRLNDSHTRQSISPSLPTNMSFSQSWPHRMACALSCALALLPHTSALTVEYCSDINTSSNSKNVSTYQSNGACTLFCQDNYAFAVLQYNGCWCSDYAPATNTTGCTTSCPGYPDDLCGGSGLYGYIALTIAPSGTLGASSKSVAQVTVTAAAEPQTILQTVTETPTPSEVASSSSSTTSSSTPTTGHSPTSQTASDTTWTPTPVTSLETVTGQVRTVTVTPTVPPNSGSSSAIKKSSDSSGLSTGAAVGLTVGLVALVAILGSIAYFCWRRREKIKAEELNNMSRRGSTVGVGGVLPSRSMSDSSRYVLNTDGRQVVESWEAENDQVGTRRSRLMATVDPRLDPFAKVYQRAGDSKSRESVNTIRDDHDYSRRINQQGPILRATNPDPDTTLDR